MEPWLLAGLLFAAALALILAEFVVPGAVLGVTGVILLIVSGAIAVRVYPSYTFAIVAGELAGTLVVLIAGMWMLSHTRAGKHLILSANMNPEEGYVNIHSASELVGSEGLVVTALRPAGTILVNGERLDAVSDGAFIARDAHVRIIEVHGNRVVVEQSESA